MLPEGYVNLDVIWHLYNLNCGLHLTACLQVETPIVWPHQGASNTSEPPYIMPRGRIARVCAKLLKPGQSEVERARDEIQGVETRLSDLETQMDVLSAAKADAEAASRNAAAELTSAVAVRDIALGSSAEAEHALNALQAEVTDLQQLLSNTVSALEAVREEQTTASDQAVQAHSNLLLAAANLTAVTADKDAAETSRDQVQLENTGLQNAVTSLQQQLTNAQHALVASQAELSGADAQLSQAGFSRHHLSHNLAAVHSRQQTSAQRSNELQGLLRNAQQQLIQTQHRETTAREQLSAQQTCRACQAAC